MIYTRLWGPWFFLLQLVDAMFTRDELVAASGLGIRTHKDKHHTPLDRKKLAAIKGKRNNNSYNLLIQKWK